MALCASAQPAFGVDDFAFYHENVMGTSLELRVLADDTDGAMGRGSGSRRDRSPDVDLQRL